MAFFFLAFLPQFVDPERGPVWTQVLVLGAILGTLGFPMDCSYAIVSAAAAGALRGRGTGKVTGAVYLALGAGRRADRWPALILEGDNLAASCGSCPTASSQMIYLDPPFNTGRDAGAAQTWHARRDRSAATGRASAGAATRASCSRESAYEDDFDDYLGFLAPRLEEARRAARRRGTLYLHLDYREAHYVKVLLDELFGRECFLNELIWAYDYGAKPKSRWPPKHDTILVYVKDPRGTTSTPRRSTASRTWPRAWSRPRRPPGASCRCLVAHDQGARRRRRVWRSCPLPPVAVFGAGRCLGAAAAARGR